MLDPNKAIENIQAFFELYRLTEEELKQKYLQTLKHQYPAYEFKFTQDLKLEAKLFDKKDVKVLPELPSQVEKLTLWHCAELSDISALSQLQNLKELTILDCPNLTDLTVLSSLTNLKSLEIEDCPKLSAASKKLIQEFNAQHVDQHS